MARAIVTCSGGQCLPDPSSFESESVCFDSRGLNSLKKEYVFYRDTPSILELFGLRFILKLWPGPLHSRKPFFNRFLFCCFLIVLSVPLFSLLVRKENWRSCCSPLPFNFMLLCNVTSCPSPLKTKESCLGGLVWKSLRKRYVVCGKNKF